MGRYTNTANQATRTESSKIYITDIRNNWSNAREQEHYDNVTSNHSNARKGATLRQPSLDNSMKDRPVSPAQIAAN